MSDKTIHIGEIMRPRFIVVDGMETVTNAIRRMAAEDANVLIIDKRHDDDEYGIVLLRDITSRVLAANRAPARVNVYEIMSKPVVTVDVAMKARYCARLFYNLGISTAPVVRNGEIVGVVSYRELVFAGMADEIDPTTTKEP